MAGRKNRSSGVKPPKLVREDQKPVEKKITRKRAASSSRQPKYFHVQKIIGKRIEDGQVQYRVLWKDYEMTESSWERATNLRFAKDAVADFEARNRPVSVAKTRSPLWKVPAPVPRLLDGPESTAMELASLPTNSRDQRPVGQRYDGFVPLDIFKQCLDATNGSTRALVSYTVNNNKMIASNHHKIAINQDSIRRLDSAQDEVMEELGQLKTRVVNLESASAVKKDVPKHDFRSIEKLIHKPELEQSYPCTKVDSEEVGKEGSLGPIRVSTDPEVNHNSNTETKSSMLPHSQVHEAASQAAPEPTRNNVLRDPWSDPIDHCRKFSNGKVMCPRCQKLLSQSWILTHLDKKVCLKKLSARRE